LGKGGQKGEMRMRASKGNQTYVRSEVKQKGRGRAYQQASREGRACKTQGRRSQRETEQNQQKLVGGKKRRLPLETPRGKKIEHLLNKWDERALRKSGRKGKGKSVGCEGTENHIRREGGITEKGP